MRSGEDQTIAARARFNGESEAAFCLRCQEVLPPERDPPCCPACGSSYDPADRSTYLPEARFVCWRYWLPGLWLAGTLGGISFAALAPGGQTAVTLSVSLCLAVGVVLGFGTSLVLRVLFALACAAWPFGLCILFLWPAGILGLLAFLIGSAAGTALRIARKLSRWDQRFFLP